MGYDEMSKEELLNNLRDRLMGMLNVRISTYTPEEIIEIIIELIEIIQEKEDE